jgi:hypothetical protein
MYDARYLICPQHNTEGVNKSPGNGLIQEQKMDRLIDSQKDGGFKIEKGIPMPERRGQGRWSKLIMGMVPGDSFLATQKEAHGFQKAARKAGCRTTAQTLDATAAKPIRVWLVEKGWRGITKNERQLTQEGVQSV